MWGTTWEDITKKAQDAKNSIKDLSHSTMSTAILNFDSFVAKSRIYDDQTSTDQGGDDSSSSRLKEEFFLSRITNKVNIVKVKKIPLTYPELKNSRHAKNILYCNKQIDDMTITGSFKCCAEDISMGKTAIIESKLSKNKDISLLSRKLTKDKDIDYSDWISNKKDNVITRQSLLLTQLENTKVKERKYKQKSIIILEKYMKLNKRSDVFKKENSIMKKIPHDMEKRRKNENKIVSENYDNEGKSLLETRLRPIVSSVESMKIKNFKEDFIIRPLADEKMGKLMTKEKIPENIDSSDSLKYHIKSFVSFKDEKKTGKLFFSSNVIDKSELNVVESPSLLTISCVNPQELYNSNNERKVGGSKINNLIDMNEIYDNIDHNRCESIKDDSTDNGRYRNDKVRPMNTYSYNEKPKNTTENHKSEYMEKHDRKEIRNNDSKSVAVNLQKNHDEETFSSEIIEKIDKSYSLSIVRENPKLKYKEATNSLVTKDLISSKMNEDRIEDTKECSEKEMFDTLDKNKSALIIRGSIYSQKKGKKELTVSDQFHHENEFANIDQRQESGEIVYNEDIKHRKVPNPFDVVLSEIESCPNSLKIVESGNEKNRNINEIKSNYSSTSRSSSINVKKSKLNVINACMSLGTKSTNTYYFEKYNSRKEWGESKNECVNVNINNNQSVNMNIRINNIGRHINKNPLISHKTYFEQTSKAIESSEKACLNEREKIEVIAYGNNAVNGKQHDINLLTIKEMKTWFEQPLDSVSKFSVENFITKLERFHWEHDNEIQEIERKHSINVRGLCTQIEKMSSSSTSNASTVASHDKCLSHHRQLEKEFNEKLDKKDKMLSKVLTKNHEITTDMQRLTRKLEPMKKMIETSDTRLLYFQQKEKEIENLKITLNASKKEAKSNIDAYSALAAKVKVVATELKQRRIECRSLTGNVHQLSMLKLTLLSENAHLISKSLLENKVKDENNEILCNEVSKLKHQLEKLKTSFLRKNTKNEKAVLAYKKRAQASIANANSRAALAKQAKEDAELVALIARREISNALETVKKADERKHECEKKVVKKISKLMNKLSIHQYGLLSMNEKVSNVKELSFNALNGIDEVNIARKNMTIEWNNTYIKLITEKKKKEQILEELTQVKIKNKYLQNELIRCREKKALPREEKNNDNSLNRIVEDSRSIRSSLSDDLIMPDRLLNMSKAKQFDKNASQKYIKATLQPNESTSKDTDYDCSHLFYVIEKHSELNSARNEINRLANILSDAEAERTEAFEAMLQMKRKMEEAEGRLKRYEKLGPRRRNYNFIPPSSGDQSIYDSKNRKINGISTSSLTHSNNIADEGNCAASLYESVMHLDYLKNVIFKFFTATSVNEKKSLVPVLAAVLELSSEEQVKILENIEMSSSIIDLFR